MNINTAFTRRLLTQVHADVRKHFPQINLRTAISWVGGDGRAPYFVQIDAPGVGKLDDHYKADDSFEAKAKAWMKFLEKNVPGYAAGDVDA